MIEGLAAGAVSAPVHRQWTSRDCVLYALGVGAGHEELAFTTENTGGVLQEVLPTFAVVPGTSRGAFPALDRLDPSSVVLGEQAIRLHAPIPPAGQVRTQARVVDLRHTRSSVVVVTEAESVDAVTGARRFTERRTTVVRPTSSRRPKGEPRSKPVPADRQPDDEVVYTTSADQALLYRLSGDRNPLHTDPAVARAAGFDRPILHGLCTFGFAGRALLHVVCGSDPERFLAMECRFSAPVFPGDSLTTSMWIDGGTARFRTHTQRGDVVLDRGCFEFRP
jgi:acyl dehydratase